ncbi:MAG: hypothetical protein Q8P82_03220 [bacterium]|nr:hypothetical protein [bacterium]
MEHDRPRYRPEPIEPVERNLLDLALQELGADGLGDHAAEPDDDGEIE